MIRLERLVPEIYRDSRDFRVFLKLFSLIVDVQKHDIDNWTTLYDPMLCPDEFLPLLSDFIGYRYDSSLSVTENRVIMSEFNTVIKNKGSEIGLRLAAALSMNAQLASDPDSDEYIRAVSQLQFLELFYNPETGVIQIFYPRDLTKIRDIFKYVRPVGSFLELVLTEFPEPESDLALSARATVTRRRFTDVDYDDNAVNKLQINLGQINRGDGTDTNNNLKQKFNLYKEVYTPKGEYSITSLQRLKDLIINCDYDADLDLNHDGRLNQQDVDLMQQLLLGLVKFNELPLFKS